MTCPSCAHENRPGAKFCEECAAPLRRACARCGSELRPTAKFCDECGTPARGAPSEPKASEVHRAAVPRASDPAGARKIVTIVFADLAGSTALQERLDPESARRFMESYYDAMRGAVETHGGRVVKLLGDGVMAAFGVPRVAEDDAIRAARAAVAMQEAFRALAGQQVGVGLRVAVNTGEVVVSSDDSDVVGDPVNVAARLQEQARDGDVVVGDATARLVSALVTLAPLGSFALKGRAEAVAAFRVESLERPESAALAAFVGRDAELARITAVYETAVEKPATSLAVLLGSPGLGKSRLIDEFARRLGETALIVAAQCDAAEGATFAPLAAALRERLGIASGADADAVRTAIEAALPGGDAERARIATGVAALLAASPAAPEETFFVVRRLFAALAAQRPLVLVIDDLQWAEALLLDLVEHLVQWGSGVPVFVLIGARPELRDLRSSLVTPGGLVSDVVTLGGLDAGAAMRLAANVIGAADLPAAIAAKVLAASEGNPLFVGELVRMLVHEGALTREGERWTTGTALAALEMPPTIHALLASRIERLRPEERSVLERAAVVGRSFSRSAVAELLPRDVTDLDARLESLRRSELIERDSGWFLGEPVLRFHHTLIRDAAYRQLLKGTRADLHARFADWASAKAGGAIEHDETIGWHLEQAHQLLRELGPIDARGRALGERASTHLAAAGRRALARDDLPLAAGLLGRALARLDPSDPARAELALDWCEALLAAGDVGPAAAAIGELARFTADSARLTAWHTCFAGQHTVLTTPSALHATAGAVAAAAESLAAQNDAAGEAKAHFVHALALSRLGKVGDCEAALDRALAAARRAGDRRRANTVLAIAPLAALWGPSPVTRASGRCLDVVRVLRITQGAPAVEAVALSCQGVLEALRGRGEAARRMLASARKMVEELGITQRLLEADVFGGIVELLEGDAAAAERSLRGAYEGLRDLGLGIDAARAAALLARALLAQERVAEAEALSHESEALAGDDLKAAIAWRGVRAEALAKRGEPAAAVEFASKAVELATATDALLDHADARLALAAALRAAGRGREADAEERRATELWQAKGATLLAERARRDAAPSESPTAMPAEAAPSGARGRPARPNFATEGARRLEAAVAARDAQALASVYRSDIEIIDHPHGATYGYEAIVERLRSMIEDSTDTSIVHEPLVTFGDALALFRARNTASLSAAYGISAGATEVPYLLLIEADEQGRARHIEFFGDNKLADARVCLYQRYAELLPEGAERTRALAVAHSLATLRSSEGTDTERLAPVLAPDFEGVDHRHLSSWSLRGATAYIEHLRALREVADDVVFREDDILALEPRAMLVATLHTGIARAGRGAYERAFLTIFATDSEGRLARAEWFDADREAEALARFEALVAEQAVPRQECRVHANAASAAIERFESAFAANDAAILESLWSEALEVVDHLNGVSYGRDGHLESIRGLLRAGEPVLRFVPLATLGPSLCLSRRSIAASGTGGSRIDVAEWKREEILVAEVDERGSFRRFDVYGEGHLGDAIARLYERYAEQLPEGAARARAEGTARSVAVVAPGGFDRDRYAAAFRADVAIVDHKLLGLGSGVGLETLFRSMAAGGEVADQVVSHPQDVLALTHNALLLRWLASGVGRESGGAFEWAFLRLFVFDQDGRVARYELFDDDREAEALARFDSLTAAHDMPPVLRRRVRANAATRGADGFVAAIESRDAGALAALFDDALHVVHNPTGADYGKHEMLATWRSALRAERIEFRGERIASLGDTLALHRVLTAVEGLRESHLADFGSTEVDEISLIETDADGRWLHVELFAPDRLGDACVRLYERWAESLPEGSGHARAAAVAHAAIAVMTPINLDRMAAAVTPDLRLTDHRVLATWSAETGAELVEHFRHHLGLAPDFAPRIDDVLALEPRALVARITYVGTARDSGGAFENRCCVLYRFGDDGRIAEIDCFEAEQEAEAIARFDALTDRNSQVSPETFANAASRSVARGMHQLWAARDWDGILAMISPTMRMDDRRRIVRLEIGYDEFVTQFRMLFDQPGSRWREQLVATRGERLALTRTRFEAEVADGGGPLAFDDHLSLAELDAEGCIAAFVTFDLDDEDAAYAELDARFAADPGALHGRVVGEFVRAVAARDWDAIAAQCRPTLVEHDHRRLAVLGTTHGAEAWVQNFRALVELAPDTIYRSLHFRTAERGFLSVGTWLGSREGGRYEIPLVAVLEVDARGAIARADLYEPDQHGQALARFRGLETATETSPRFANAASRADRKLFDCFDARDWAGIEALAAPDLVFDERRRMVRNSCGREVWLEQFRVLFDVPQSRFTTKLRATRGERLSLNLHGFAGMVAGGGGPLAIDDHLVLHEIDREGRFVAIVLFDLEDEDAALAELDARFAVGEGAAHPLAAKWLADYLRYFAARDWDAMRARFAPDLVGHNHRLVGWGTLHGPAALVSTLEAQVALAPDTQERLAHVRTCARGVLFEYAWHGTHEGGAFENVWLVLVELDHAGRARRADVWEAEQQADALARFEALQAAASSTARFANAATRAGEQTVAAWMAADWERFASLFPADARLSDRRRAVQLELGRDELIAFSRSLGEHATTRIIHVETLATRGERLALQRWRVELDGDGVGPAEISHLNLMESDERGPQKGAVRWDDDAIDAAYAELDARFEAGEGAAHPHALACEVATNAAIRSRDWDALAALCAPTFRLRDHRLLGWGTIVNDAATFVRVIRSAVELAPDASYRKDHLRICARGILSGMALCGTRDGGAFENPFLRVTEVDEQGRVLSSYLYDESDFERALARFAELAAPAAPAGRFENAASRAWRAVNDAWTARDLERFAAPHAAALRYRDHRRLFQLDLDRAGFLDFTRPLLTMRAGDASLDLVATRGERLALMRSVMEMEDESVGPSVIESLMLIETDARGDIAVYDRWDLEDEDAAWAEIEARWNAGEGGQSANALAMREFGAALERRDWDAAAACYAPDFVGHDHRLVGWGTVRGPSAFVRTLQEMVVLAPDLRMRANHRRVCARGAIHDMTWLGTRDGGAFESPFVTVTEIGADGRTVRADFYDLHHQGRAFARLEEMGASERRDPLAAGVKPNLATAAVLRSWIAFDELDLDTANEALDAARATFAPDFVWEDRRPVVGLSGGLDLMIASARERLASGARHERRTIVGTAGERVAIVRVLWAGGPADGRFEVEFLVVSEVNEAGLFTALIFFEPADTRAAQREAWARWAAIDPVAAPWVDLLNEITDGWNARDRSVLRARFTDDVVVEDHRLTGIGRIDGAVAYVDANAVLWDLAPDQRIEFDSSWLTFDRHGLVATLRRVGTLADGGAFESEYVWLSLARDGRITHLELFEVEQRDRALTRFEELRPYPLHLPPTAATRLRDRHRDAFVARDWDAVRALTSADFVFDDRGKRALVRGDVESWIASMEFTSQPGFRVESALMGTLGDRIVLDHVRWFGKPDGDAFEFERVRLLEVGEDGLLRAVLFFDPEDRFAASVEGLARFAAGEAAGSAGIAPLVALYRALGVRSWDTVRACFAPDLVFVDHRPLGLGTLDREQWITSLHAGDELGDGIIIEVIRVLAWSEQGHVAAIRRFGTIADGGGPFEVEAILTGLVVDGQIRRVEVFGEADAERAVARFAELCAEHG